jgi:cytochrome P450
LSILVAEIDLSRKNFVAANPSNTPIADDPTALHAWLSNSGSSMPLLNSAIQETLRYCSSTFSIRLVTRDTVLAGHHIQEGEKVICMTRAVHLDEEVHEYAGQYEPARYMDSSKTRTKDGKRVANHSMPFGGGVSMCEGRYVSLRDE